MWSAYGLRDGKSLVLRQWDRTGGFYTFEAEAPTPAVIELVLGWGALLREAPPWTREKAETALAAQASCRIGFRSTPTRKGDCPPETR